MRGPRVAVGFRLCQKKKLAAAIDALPEGLSFEQAMARIRQIYKSNQGSQSVEEVLRSHVAVGPWAGNDSDELFATLLGYDQPTKSNRSN